MTTGDPTGELRGEGSGERSGGPAGDDQAVVFDLRLYVAGQSPKSIRAIENLRRVCEEHLPGRYRVEVIDLLENPKLARGDEIIAVPTLVRRLPQPIRSIIGDLSDTDRVLIGLQLRPEDRGPP
jgi:circadian clock protein KaiB